MSSSSSTPASAEGQKKSRHWAAWLIVILVLGGGGGYLLSQRTSSKGSGSGSGSAQGGRRGAGGPIPVGTAKVTRGNMGVYINALGTVTPVYTVTVTSRVTGQLMDVRYREGQIVDKGEILAVIDPRPYTATVTQAQGQLQRDQASLKNALIDLDRYRSVLAQHAIPEQTVATQEAVVGQDQGAVKVDQGNLDAANINLEYATIRSPIKGRVGLRTVDPGNIVPANGTTGIATITQLQPITVIFTMAEDYIDQVVTQLRAGHRLRVDARDRTDMHEIAQGSVLTLDNQIDVTTGTVRVRATFPNTHYELFPNEFVNAQLLVKTLSGVNLIPTAAIQRNNDVAFVYVVDTAANTVHSRNIQIASTNDLQAAVTGVSEGELLVTDGFDRLVDGAKISVAQTRTGRVPVPGQTPGQGSPQSQAAGEANPATAGNAGSTSESDASATETTGQPNEEKSGQAQQGSAGTQVSPNQQQSPATARTATQNPNTGGRQHTGQNSGQHTGPQGGGNQK